MSRRTLPVAQWPRRHPWAALIVMGAVIAQLGCGADHAARALAPPPPPLTSFVPLHPPVPADPDYRSEVEAGVASSLHLTSEAVAVRLRARPGSTLMDLAKPLGIAEDSLSALVLRSLEDAADTAVRSGRWPGVSGGEEKRFWELRSAPSLISEVSYWFVHR